MDKEFWYWARILIVIGIVIIAFTGKYEEKRISIISDIGELR